MTVREVKRSEMLALLYFAMSKITLIIRVCSLGFESLQLAGVFCLAVSFKINLNILDWRLNKQMRCMEL